MRELTLSEMNMVAGAGDECPADDGNTYGGIKEPDTVGDEMIKIYEGLVAATSHVIERVANAL
jgi:hypothetical protein